MTRYDFIYAYDNEHTSPCAVWAWCLRLWREFCPASSSLATNCRSLSMRFWLNEPYIKRFCLVLRRTPNSAFADSLAESSLPVSLSFEQHATIHSMSLTSLYYKYNVLHHDHMKQMNYIEDLKVFAWKGITTYINFNTVSLMISFEIWDTAIF